MKILPAIFAALIMAGSLHAEVTVETLGVASERPKTRVPQLHVFGGQSAELEIAVDAPLGAKVSLTVALFQIATGIAAPLGAETPVGEPIEFEKVTHRVIRVPLPVPEVKRVVQMLVRFHAKIEGSETSARAGEARLFVYPKEQIPELAVSLGLLEKDTGPALAVFGESKRIRAFLKQSKIPFTDVGVDLPEQLKKSALYIGEVDAHSTQTRAPGSRLVFFSPDPALLPGVYMSVTESGLRTKVTLPLLDTLATNPQSQRSFIDILRHSLEASTITASETP